MTCRQHRNLPPAHDPTDGLNDHWHEPPKWPEHHPRWLAWALAILLCLIALALLFQPVRAPAHDHNRPELEMWFRQQFSGHGPCCDGTDAKHVSDVEWDSFCKDGQCHYRVMAYNRWWDVPDQAVVYGPNMSGTALLWAVPTLDGDKVISVFIRCFMPGAGG